MERSMKKAANFRFNVQTLYLLTALAEKMHLSKTAVIENALEAYAKKQHSLFKYAGSLNQQQADRIQLAIHSK